MDGSLRTKISNFLSSNPGATVCSIDLETLVTDSEGFLSGESIIAASVSFFREEIQTFVFVSDSDTQSEEMRVLRELDQKFAEISPDVIIGYNHTGYDIPLIVSKIRNLEYADRNRNLEYYFGTSWCLDMKYLFAEDLYSYDGFYRIRKLEEVLLHEKYAPLPTMKAKDIVHIEGMDKGEAIKYLWLNEKEKFRQYSTGDSHDLIVLFNEIVKE